MLDEPPEPEDERPLVGNVFRGARLVLFDADSDQYEARVARRRRVLTMRPINPRDEHYADRARVDDEAGAFWELLQPDDSPLMTRARQLADADQARRDAAGVFAASARLRTVFVVDRDSGHLGWWLAWDRDIALVSARVWRSDEVTPMARHAKRAVRALRTRPPWGTYRP